MPIPMESCSLHSPTVTTIPSSLSRNGLIEKSFLCGQVLKLPYLKRNPCARKLKFLDFRVRAAGTTKISSEVVESIPKNANPKDEGLAFVAGATGKVGSRTVRELLKLGFRVRAGVRSAQKAETLVQSVKQMNLDFVKASEGSQPVEKLEIVECDLEKRDQIGPALGNASVVICCIGASEKEVFDITGPYRIDYQATKNLIDAATVAKVNHFILVSSLGTNKIGFPAAILNLFWGVLIWKRKAEEALIASGIPYTIVRPGGMERPTDAYKETHNVTLSQEDTLFGGQVSNLQVAELMAVMAKNRGLTYCKVVEVIAETTAPLTPMEELLAKVPSQRADIYTTKESEAEGPDVAPPKSVVSEAFSPPIEKEPTQEKATVTRPLSPFIVYENLKPSTYPTPTSSTTLCVTKTTDVDAVPAPSESTPPGKLTCLNPQAPPLKRKLPRWNYDDLKPPTSPTPTPPSSQKENINILEAVLKPTSGTKSGINETKIDLAEVKKMMPLSPYVAYEDLKPPTSPSPTPSGPKELPFSASTPVEVVLPSTGGNDLAKIIATDVVEKDPPQDLTSYRSPYPVYEDLKPPTTPTPSPKKST